MTAVQLLSNKNKHWTRDGLFSTPKTWHPLEKWWYNNDCSGFVYNSGI